MSGDADAGLRAALAAAMYACPRCLAVEGEGCLDPQARSSDVARPVARLGDGRVVALTPCYRRLFLAGATPEDLVAHEAREHGASGLTLAAAHALLADYCDHLAAARRRRP